MTLIVAILLSAFVANATEPGASSDAAGAAVVDQVLKTNDQVQMNSCQCDLAPTLTASTDRSNKNMCAVIGELAKGDPKLFDLKNPYGLCAPEWGTPVPEWRQAEAQAKIQTYATAAYKAPTRNDFVLKNKYTVLDMKGRASLIAQTRSIQEASAKACCGTDEACLKPMRNVRISVCASEADQDPTKTDGCTATGGAYSLSLRENAIMALKMQFSIGVGTLMRPPEIEKAIQEAKALLGPSEYTEPFPATGEIILSPYVDSNHQPISELGTLHHEFGHACSFIRRQLATGSGQPNAEQNAMSFFQAKANVCAISDERQSKAYSSLLKKTGAPEAVESCLLDLAKQSTEPNSSAFVANSCQINKIEEATAEAFAYYTLRLMPDAFPQRACHRLPSTRHPASVDVFSCVIKADPVKRRDLAMKYRCPGVR